MNIAVATVDALALSVHAGAAVVFALLIAFRARIPHVQPVDLIRAYRCFGAGFGLSLGLLVPSEIYRHCTTLNPGTSLPAALALNFDTDANCAWSLRLLTLFALWISYIWLEVWTNEPTRQLDKGGLVIEPVAYSAAVARVSGHLNVHAGLGAAVVSLGAWAQVA